MNVPPPPRDGTADNFSLVHKLLSAYAEFSGTIHTLDKHHRYTLGVKIENELLETLELILLALSKKGSSRMLLLQKIDLQMKLIQLLTRLLTITKAVTAKKYIHLSGLLVELSRMNGGWIRDEKAANEHDQEKS